MKTIADMEKDLIIETLNDCLGVRSCAAKSLGVSLRKLYELIKKYGITT